MQPTVLSTRQAAELLGTSQRAVQEFYKRGHFPHAYKLDPTRSNSPLRIPKPDLDAFLAKRQPNQGE